MGDDSYLLPSEVRRTAEEHRQLERVIRRGGVLGFDPATQVGQEVDRMMRELEAAADPRIPAPIRQQAAEIGVEITLLRRSAFRVLAALEAPKPARRVRGRGPSTPNGDGEEGDDGQGGDEEALTPAEQAKRDAAEQKRRTEEQKHRNAVYNSAVSAHRSYVLSLRDVCALLGLTGLLDPKGKPPEGEEDFYSGLRKIQEEHGVRVAKGEAEDEAEKLAEAKRVRAIEKLSDDEPPPL